ncbi:MAG: cell division protein ZapE [Candidatus Eutrophobiaceae bacterium]
MAASSQMTPWLRYQKDLQGELFHDLGQEEVVRVTEGIHHALVEQMKGQKATASPPLWRMLFSKRLEPIKGLYLWGGVGCGKTWIMDCFCECLPKEWCFRLHYYRFMQHVHDLLKDLRNERDPLARAAQSLYERGRVICLDEFHVNDITDAMILSRLLENLFALGATLLTTSNEHPDQLYRDGLQRERFLPAIALIKGHTRVMQLKTAIDYRMHYLRDAELYHIPADGRGDQLLNVHFRHLTNGLDASGDVLDIHGRPVRVRGLGSGVAWFNFPALCEEPRGSSDYTWLARGFNTILLSGIPVMGDEENEAARRLIYMLDEFYDRNVKLIATAMAPPESLYTGKRLQREFQRIVSRLNEMGSRDYLTREHRP